MIEIIVDAETADDAVRECFLAAIPGPLFASRPMAGCSCGHPHVILYNEAAIGPVIAWGYAPNTRLLAAKELPA